MSEKEEIEVTVKAFGGLRVHIDPFPLRVHLPASARLDDLISFLEHNHPRLHSELSEGLRKGYVNILVNGRNIRFLDGLHTKLADGTSVAFIPPVGGG